MNKVKEFINNNNNIAIVSHVSPDGDTIGSALALFFALKKTGKDVKVYCNDKPKSIFSFIPGIHLYKNLDNITEKAVIYCDCADLKRSGHKEAFANSLVIDHHISNTEFGSVNYIVHNASATCEIMYEVIASLGIELDEQICTCLYLGICTDTNNFTNSNVTSNTFRVASKICEIDFGIADIVKKIYRTRSLAKTEAIARVIQNMQFFHDKKICISSLTLQEIEALGLEETEGLVDYIVDIKGVSVGGFIKEYEKDKFKLSLRSNYDVDVQDICCKFGGGGHVKAAGCAIAGTKQQVISSICSEVSKWME